jgi:hypothetical protein
MPSLIGKEVLSNEHEENKTTAEAASNHFKIDAPSWWIFSFLPF